MLVRIVQGQADFTHDAAGFCRRDERVGCAIAAQHRFQVGPIDVLHGHVEQVARFSIAIQPDDVRVLQPGDGLRFTLETGHVFGVGAQRGIDYLDRHVALEVDIQGAIDARHPALPQQRIEAILVKLDAQQAGRRASGRLGRGRRFVQNPLVQRCPFAHRQLGQRAARRGLDVRGQFLFFPFVLGRTVAKQRVLQRRHQCLAGLVTLSRAFAQRFQQHGFGFGVEGGVQLAGRRRRLGHVLEGDHRRRRIVKGHCAGQHLVQHHAQRVQVGLGNGVGRGARLFGRNVMRAAERLAQRALVHIHRQAEIGQHHPSFFGQHDVGRLDVAVDHAFLVGIVERAGNGATDPEHVFVSHQLAVVGIPGEQASQVRSVNVFHRKIIQAILVIGIINLDDVFVPPRGHRLRLTDEALCIRRILPVARIDDLDRHRTLQLGVPALVNLGHSPAADELLDAISGELLADQRVFSHRFLPPVAENGFRGRRG